MTYLVLDDEQLHTIAGATGSVEVRDGHGRHLGYFNQDIAHGFSAEDIQLALQRRKSTAPRLTTSEVLERLRRLQEAG